MTPDIWTEEELSKFLRVSPEIIADLVRTNTIPHFRVGPVVRFRKDEILKWTASDTSFDSESVSLSASDAHGRNRMHLSGDKKTLYVILGRSHSSINYSLIPLSDEVRDFFPGYKMDFIMETSTGNITTRVTSAPDGTRIGAPDKGRYVQGGLTEWFRRNKADIEKGYCLRIRQIEKGKRYRLDMVSPEEALVRSGAA